ncbi:MAG: hypothetical protein RR553_00400 [Akkermansia sp.]
MYAHIFFFYFTLSHNEQQELALGAKLMYILGTGSASGRIL